MARNEKTSAAVASKAARIMKSCDQEIAALRQFEGQVASMVEGLINTLSQAKRVAASALTQTADKKKPSRPRTRK